MAERPWGFWTESKLDMLQAYMPAFTTASKRAGTTVYLDLFAGQATNVRRDTGAPIEGSFLRALQSEPAFAVLRGFEKNPQRARSLQAAFRNQFPGRDVIVHAGDVHNSLQGALRELSPHRWSPTFAFVDPDGVEARWELLEMLAAHKAPGRTKVELFLLLATPQVHRVVHDNLAPNRLQHAEQQITDLFGSDQWRPILQARRAGFLNPSRARDELTNLMRWRLERALGYQFTHALRLTNVTGTPLYDMIFATDHAAGDKIMRSVYSKAAEKFPKMRQEARARRQDQRDQEAGTIAMFSHLELVSDTTLGADESYQHRPPDPPYGHTPDRE